tara:strand:- start:364 stop:705 length:342 start_codon:yes stop_codon:yes gene_type:complete
MQRFDACVFDNEIQALESDDITMTHLMNCVFKAMKITNTDCTQDALELLVEEKNVLMQQNKMYISKIVNTVALWILYLQLLKCAETDPHIPGIHDKVVDIKLKVAKEWNEIMQ